MSFHSYRFSLVQNLIYQRIVDLMVPFSTKHTHKDSINDLTKWDYEPLLLFNLS
jgi:hypothetical protein